MEYSSLFSASDCQPSTSKACKEMVKSAKPSCSATASTSTSYGSFDGETPMKKMKMPPELEETAEEFNVIDDDPVKAWILQISEPMFTAEHITDVMFNEIVQQMDMQKTLPPVSDDLLEQLPSFWITLEEENSELQCALCFGYFEKDNEVVELICNHIFHIQCIRTWYAKCGNCLACLRDVPKQNRCKSSESS